MSRLKEKPKRMGKCHGNKTRKHERRNCTHYDNCLDLTAKANWSAVPCYECSGFNPKLPKSKEKGGLNFIL